MSKNKNHKKPNHAQHSAKNKKNTAVSEKTTAVPKQNTKSSGWKEWLISLAVTLVVLGIVVALEYWFANTSGLGMNIGITWLGNAIGGIVMLFIVHHFVKKPSDDGYRP